MMIGGIHTYIRHHHQAQQHVIIITRPSNFCNGFGDTAVLPSVAHSARPKKWSEEERRKEALLPNMEVGSDDVYASSYQSFALRRRS
jgi:hypothetical protein